MQELEKGPAKAIAGKEEIGGKWYGKKEEKEKEYFNRNCTHNSSFNTKVLISDVQGNAIAWSSSGTMGFKGLEKLHLTQLNWQLRCWKKGTRAWNEIS